jgi:hypothetical protein
MVADTASTLAEVDASAVENRASTSSIHLECRRKAGFFASSTASIHIHFSTPTSSIHLSPSKERVDEVDDVDGKGKRQARFFAFLGS